jgi:tRNA-Thr(GGU) m(6)t(6)A37 methyltransferase TsaA
MDITYHSIGTVRSPHQTTDGMPIQPSRAEGVVGTIEVDEEYAEGLDDLDGFSHVIVIAHLHRASSFKLRVVPYLDTEHRGLFATRAPSRPNPIGISVLKLLGIEGSTIRVEGIDLLDGTPVLDLKPYVPEFDPETDVRCGWLDSIRNRTVTADSRFEK